MNGNAMLKPALMGGLVMGVLSALPGVSLGNCCCCAWLVTGGLVAAYLLQSNTPEPIAGAWWPPTSFNRTRPSRSPWATAPWSACSPACSAPS